MEANYFSSLSQMSAALSCFEVCSDSICDLTMNPSALKNSMVESRLETMVNPEMQIIQQMSLSCCLDNRLFKNRSAQILLFTSKHKAECCKQELCNLYFWNAESFQKREKKTFVLEILLCWCTETRSPKHMKSS